MNRKQRRIISSKDKPQVVIRVRGNSCTVEEATALALKEYRSGNIKAASDIYCYILAKFPNHIDSHFNLAITQQAMQQYGDALTSYNKVVALKPDYVIAHNNLGNTLQSMGRYNDAVESYDKAILLKPDFAEVYVNRGVALQQLNRYEAALASYAKAIAIRPDQPVTYNNQGITLQEMKRYDDAAASFSKAIELNPHYAEALNNLGNVLVSKGNMLEAEKMFRKALALKPEFPGPLLGLANIHKYRDAEHPDILRIRTLLGKVDISQRDKESLYFSLGKIYDDCNLYDEAFEYYRQANQIRNAAVSYDRNTITQTADNIIRVFNPRFFKQNITFEPGSQSPLFIVGMPRSGTTLMASILSNHPRVATAGELPDFREFTLHLSRRLASNLSYPQVITEMTPEVAASLIREYELRLRRDVTSDVAYVIDKYPLNFWHLGFIAMLFPKARIIHCTRHPLDIAVSNYFQRFSLQYDYAYDLENIGHFYGEYIRMMEHWQKALPIQMIEISYEEMITGTAKVTRRALDYLGLEWDERCLSPHTNTYAVETASNWQVRQPIYSQSVGRWRHYEKYLAGVKAMVQFIR